jgi:hypothetical protein
MPEDDLFKYKYLIDAKKNIDEAVAIAEADIRDKDEIARVLAEAGEKACEALTLLEKDSEYWAQLRKPTKDLVRKAVSIITRDRDRFKVHVLPVSVEALVRLGFKPPEEAERVVEEARKACERLDENAYDLASRAEEAERSWRRLRDDTCRVARESNKLLDSREKRQALVQKARNGLVTFLIFVSSTLLAASLKDVGHALAPKDMTDPSHTAPRIITVEYIILQASRSEEAAQDADWGLREAEEMTYYPPHRDRPHLA